MTLVTRECYPDGVKTLTIRDLRTRPRQARATLKDAGEAMLTANGRPVALMIAVDAETIDETLETLRRARGLEALRAIRRESQERGLDRLTSAEIDAIIAQTRRSRAPRARARG